MNTLTCVLIWLTVDDKQVPPKVVNCIEEAEVVYSIPLSLVELLFKELKGQVIQMSFERFVQFLTFEERFYFLPFGEKAANAFRSLPWHHKDPFDRMLISQVLAEDITFVTPDSHAKDNPIQVLW